MIVHLNKTDATIEHHPQFVTAALAMSRWAKRHQTSRSRRDLIAYRAARMRTRRLYVSLRDQLESGGSN